MYYLKKKKKKAQKEDFKEVLWINKSTDKSTETFSHQDGLKILSSKTYRVHRKEEI